MSRCRWCLALVAPSFVGLAAVLIALALGRFPRPLWPAASFVTVWAAISAYMLLAYRALRRRAYRLRASPPLFDVPLRRPAWIGAGPLLALIVIVSPLATVIATLGYIAIPVGIYLAVTALTLLGQLTNASGIRALGFERSGLRFHCGATRCLVPWTSVGEVEVIGSETFQTVRMTVVDLAPILASVSPDTVRNRERAQQMFATGSVSFEPWTAGLDGQTLARAIEGGRDGVWGRSV
jgi:hypothetical protein